MKSHKTKILLLITGILITIAIIFLISVQIYDNKKNISSNHFLYKIDIFNEKFALVLSRSKSRMGLYIKFMNERILELKKVSKKEEINKIVEAFDYLYNKSQRELAKITDTNKKISYQKNIIGLMFSLLEQMSVPDQEAPIKVIEKIALSIDALSDEEKINVIKENSDKIKTISKSSNDLLNKIKDILPTEIAENLDSIIDDNGDEEVDDPEEPDIPEDPVLLEMSVEKAFSLAENEIIEIGNIETINVMADKNIFSIGVLIDKRNPAYEEVIEEDLTIIFRYSAGQYVKIGTYFTDAIDADKTIGTRSEIKALSLTADELKWLIFNQKENQIINFY